MNTATSLILPKENLADLVWYSCMRCQKHLFKLNRDTLVIYVGMQYPDKEIPQGMGWLQAQCHSCKKQYNFYFQ